MVIFIVAFVGLCFVFTTTYADVEFPVVAKGIVGSALGLAAVGVIYGIVRTISSRRSRISPSTRFKISDYHD